MERLSLRFSGGLIKICKFNLLSQFSSFQCPTPPFALLHSKDLSINGFSSACLNKREYIEFLFDTLYLETGRIKKRKVDSSLKRNKNECGLSNPPPMCNRETWWYYQIRSARKSYNYEKFFPLLLLSTEPRSFHNPCKNTPYRSVEC